MWAALRKVERVIDAGRVRKKRRRQFRQGNERLGTRSLWNVERRSSSGRGTPTVQGSEFMSGRRTSGSDGAAERRRERGVHYGLLENRMAGGKMEADGGVATAHETEGGEQPAARRRGRTVVDGSV